MFSKKKFLKEANTYYFLSFLLLLAWQNYSFAISNPKESKVSSIQVPELYHSLEYMQKKIVEIQKSLSIKKRELIPFPIKNAMPYEVYFQAKNLVKKSYFLAQTVAKNIAMPEISRDFTKDIIPGDVFKLIQKAHEYLKIYSDNHPDINFSPIIMHKRYDFQKNSNDVFKSMVWCNQQLHEILPLAYRISSGDVYEKLRENRLIVQKLFAHHGLKMPMFKISLPIVNDALTASYKEMAKSFTYIKKLATYYNLPDSTIEENIGIESSINNKVAPSDLFNMVTLLGADLYYFQYLFTLDKKYERVRNRIATPQSVYTQSYLLNKYLAMLVKYLEKEGTKN